KFVGLALNAFYCLLALLPVAAFAFIMGGVTGGQFWRTALALAVGLFFSLALGMCVSAFGRDSQRTLSATVVLLLLLAVGCPLLASAGQRLYPSVVWSGLSAASPLTALSAANRPNYSSHSEIFWASAVGSGLLGCLFLAAASVSLPRLWQSYADGSGYVRTRSPSAHGSAWPGFRRQRHRGTVLSQDPVRWLTEGQLGEQWAAWAVVGGWGVVVLIALAFGASAATSPVVSSYFVLPFGFVFKLLFAAQATRFFRESRQSGALDLLLCTPLTTREIVRGCAKALCFAFLWPAVVFVGLLFAPVAIRLTEAAVAHSLDPVFAAFSASILALLFVIRAGMDLLALCWFGMALALTSKRPSLSPALTVLFVLILPSIFSFCWLDMIADLVFIIWGISRLQDLRQLSARQYQPPPAGLPPVLPPQPPLLVTR
ncbi:MAG TPA: hypothetical protein VHI52_18175, partial [Verrucomicrobiae bacterium]|nr:hypothetical protein [Verrucomicrobiae bacterium]